MTNLGWIQANKITEQGFRVIVCQINRRKGKYLETRFWLNFIYWHAKHLGTKCVSIAIYIPVQFSCLQKPDRAWSNSHWKQWQGSHRVQWDLDPVQITLCHVTFYFKSNTVRDLLKFVLYKNAHNGKGSFKNIIFPLMLVTEDCQLNTIQTLDFIG